MTIAKLNGIDVSAISGVDSVSAASISKINGQEFSVSETIDLPMDADTFIRNLYPTTNYSTETYFNIGESSAATGDYNKALIKIDFSGIPANQLITSATLKMTPIGDYNTNTSFAYFMYAYRVLRNTVHAEATWNEYASGSNWIIAGARSDELDYDGDIEIGHEIQPNAPTLNAPGSFQMTLDAAEIQKFYDGTYNNYGLLLVVPSGSNNMIRYASTNHGTASYRPVVTVTYVNAPPAPEAAGYYVANSGDDSNDGLTSDTAWRTIAKVNASTFVPGDSIYFKRGDTWNESLIPPSSGSATDPITFGAYSTGEKPIINNADGYAVEINGKSYITVENIESGDADVNVYIYDAAYIIIDNCDLHGGTNCVYIDASDVDINVGIAITNCTLYDSSGSGVKTGVQQMTVLEITTCEFWNNGSTPETYEHAIEVYNCTDLSIGQNVILDSWASGIYFSVPAGAGNGIIWRNLIAGIDRGGIANAAGVYLENTEGTVIVHNNIIIDGKAMGIFLDTTRNAEIYHNTIARHYLGLVISSVYNIIKNNIIIQDTAWPGSPNSYSVCLWEISSYLPYNTYDNNLYYFKDGAGSLNPIAVDGTPESFATWQARTEAPDANGLNVDPEFVAAYEDYHLQSTSDARGAGVKITGVDMDYDGVSIGDPPDIGALQYVA